MTDTIAIAADHGGFELKQALIAAFPEYTWLDLGTNSAESVDYPDYANKLVTTLRDGKATRGVLICGTGIGISIAANRHPDMRCALVSEPVSAALTRQHNDANIIAFGARVIGIEVAKACLSTFLTTPFEGGRHQKRVDKLSTC